MSEVLYRGPRIGDDVWLFSPNWPEGPLAAKVTGFSSDAVDLIVFAPHMLLFVDGVPQRGASPGSDGRCWDWPGSLETAEVMPPEPPP
jgi:hypothetical protein